MTRILLYPLYNELMFYVNQNINICGEKIEQLYSSVVKALLTASTACIPSIPQKSLKHWWNSELTELKKNSLISHKIWVEAGKPRYGEVVNKRSKDKLAYKSAIKKVRDDNSKNISDDLHEALTSKDSNCFWKTWKSKVCLSNTKHLLIEGNPSDDEAVEELAKIFSQTTCPNSMEFDSKKRAELTENIKYYQGNSLHKICQCSAELIAFALMKMEKGKSPGFDSVSVEHLENCHPVLFSLLSNLFNSMILNSVVPLAFGKGITIPIPKTESSNGIHRLDSFRGITLSPVISKLFEHCILILFNDYFYTAANQFGFKAKLGCSHAIYTVRKVVDYYVNNNSTVNLCFFDMAKGFDKISHPMLLLKLMKRRVPVALVKLLQFWFTISQNCVRWKNIMSEPYYLLAGIRQGAVLSPILFSIYVNDFLQNFEKYGCRYKGLSVSAVMYADDLVLLAPSVSELQTMIHVCIAQLRLLDININSKKSNVIRIGSKFKTRCADLCAGQEKVEWVREAKYLGIYIVAGSTFKVNFEKTKAKFYRAANGILAKIGAKNNIPVTLKLLNTIALPILTYAIETLTLSKHELISLDHPWLRIFQKVFHTFDTEVVKLCQFYHGYLPVSLFHSIKSMTFLTKLPMSNNMLIRHIYETSDSDDVGRIARSLNCDKGEFLKSYRYTVYKHFEDSCIMPM